MDHDENVVLSILEMNKILNEADIPKDARYIHMSEKAYIGILRLQGYSEEDIKRALEEIG